MEGPVFVITLVAMCMGYSLLRHILAPRGEKISKKRRRGCEPNPMTYEEQIELQTRAEELMRRVNTLEEIVASESRSRVGSEL